MAREMLWSATLGNAPLLDRVEAATSNGYRGLTVRPDDLERLDASGVDVGDVVRRAHDGGVEHLMMEALSAWYDHEPPPVPFPSATQTLDDHLAAADRFGARHLNVVAPFASREPVEALVERFAAICDRCAASGIEVHLEFIPFPPISSLRIAHRIVEDAGRPNGGVLFDTWHFFRGDPDLELLASLPGESIRSVQVSDGAAELRESLVKDTFRHRLLPGDGVFPLVDVLRTLRAIGGLRLAGPEVLSTELDAVAPVDAARLAGEAFDRVVALSR